MEILVFIFFGLIIFYSIYAFIDMLSNKKKMNYKKLNRSIILIFILPLIGPFIYFNFLKNID